MLPLQACETMSFLRLQSLEKYCFQGGRRKPRLQDGHVILLGSMQVPDCSARELVPNPGTRWFDLLEQAECEDKRRRASRGEQSDCRILQLCRNCLGYAKMQRCVGLCRSTRCKAVVSPTQNAVEVGYLLTSRE